jgi:hypothetical protein
MSALMPVERITRTASPTAGKRYLTQVIFAVNKIKTVESSAPFIAAIGK